MMTPLKKSCLDHISGTVHDILYNGLEYSEGINSIKRVVDSMVEIDNEIKSVSNESRSL